MNSAFLAPASTPARGSRLRHLAALREHRWSAGERVALIAGLAIVMGSLFVTSYSLALGDPVPHRIDAALVGDRASHGQTVRAVQSAARDSLVFHRYPSAAAALRAIDRQQVYAALDLTSTRPTLYVASAAGASVARVLERVSAVDPSVHVVDSHPLGAHDPNGLDLFYLMLVATIVGLVTTFQVHAHAGPCRVASGRCSSSRSRSGARSSSRSSRGRCCTGSICPCRRAGASWPSNCWRWRRSRR
jgi:hypothetical protein